MELKEQDMCRYEKIRCPLPTYMAYGIVPANIVFWPPLVFAAEAVPGTAMQGGMSALFIGLAALAGAALGGGISWLFLRRKTGHASAPAALAHPVSGPAELNVANSLTAGFIHEFNNTLSTILGFTDLAILRSNGQGPERQGLEQIRIGVQRSTRLLEQLERFHMEAETEQPVPLGLVLKGYGKWLQGMQGGAATAGGAGRKDLISRVNVQVRDTSTLVPAQPLQVQRLLALLHHAAMAAGEQQEGNEVRLVLRQAVSDRPNEKNPRLELVLQGIAALPEASVGELRQITADLDGSLTLIEEDGTKSCCLSLPGQSVSSSRH